MSLPSMKTVPYTAFVLKKLPKPWYEWVKALCAATGANQRQVVLAGLQALSQLGERDAEGAQRLLQAVVERYPAKESPEA